ncbi:MAG: hypothetical protein RL417_553 [Pseudomonadota bacterium]
MSELLIAIILGIVEGLTEFVPVSSTGHLILVGHALEFRGDRSHVFEVFIQLGAILAVVWLYPRRFTGLLDFSSPDHGFRGVTAIKKLAVVSLPALIFGFLFHKTIKEQLFGPGPVAAALIVGGIALILIERIFPARAETPIEEVSLKQCFIIGLFQCLSLWPGMSRSGSTIIGGIVCGLHRTVAAEFSFLAAVPIMCAAVTYDMYKHLGVLSLADLPVFGVGFLVAFLSAIVAIRFMIALLGKFSLSGFGVYRVLLGGMVLWFLH